MFGQISILAWSILHQLKAAFANTVFCLVKHSLAIILAYWYLARPFTNLRKASEILRGHFFGKDGKGKASHVGAVADLLIFVNDMEKTLQPINEMVSNSLSDRIRQNSNLMWSLWWRHMY